MTIEKSHGKARPTLPRSSDLAAIPSAADEPRRIRDERGRVLPGNDLGRGKGWKAAVRKMLGPAVADPDAVKVAEDAWRLFAAALREMPSDGATVRSLLAIRCRHEALNAFWSAKAGEVGLATDAGVHAAEQATKHGTRAERLAVTALDIAIKLAAKRTDAPDAVAEIRAAAEGRRS